MRIFIIAYLIGFKIILSQDFSGISGKVTDSTGNPVVGATVMLEGMDIGAATDGNGDFIISKVKPGTYTVIFSAVGYKKQSRNISIESGKKSLINARLDEEAIEIDEVLVKSKSAAQELKEQGYSIEVVEIKKLKNSSRDINYALKTAPGINIRETGGLGSGFNLSLNGLSGNQIRYFIDGVPMENFGSSLSLNNYPVNLIEKLEVYKGVAPISLGSDALGGAVNIVTDNWQSSFLDAAYSYGSFNTNRASVNGQYVMGPLGAYFKGAFFYNHSDNNYPVESAPVYDLELGNLIAAKRVKRFHDDYTSSMFHGELGLFDRPYADKLAFKLIYSSGRKNYQHPDNNILRVFGDFHTKNNTLLFSANYKKKINNLDIKAYALAGGIEESVIDTGSRKYNWAGDFVVRPANDPKGELMERRSYMKLSDAVLRSSVGLDYSILSAHKISLSFSQNYLKRTGEDIVDAFNRSFESPNYIDKNMLGLAYNLKAVNGLLDASIFGKEYWYSGKIITFDYDGKELISKPALNKFGYGIIVSFQLTGALLVKSSFEKAYRIPESFEILGDGIYVNPNPGLQPETSRNFNLGLMLGNRLGKFEIKAEANLFYRLSEDFIKFNPLGPFGEYENINSVLSEGIESGLNINYNNYISLNSNMTYQNITDRTEFNEGLINTNYKSRVPNIPYLFANTVLGFSPSAKYAANKFHLYFSFRYVREFFLTWEKLGNKTEKNIIPSQFIQDVEAEYSMFEGMYNISFAVNNIWDKTAYDNFNIQKPGRSYAVKLRYFLK
jgi:outer membrane cobalamin receptor